MKKLFTHKNAVVIYQAKSGAIELRGDFSKETIWATQAQIAQVFNIERSVVTKHIGNLLKFKEVDLKSNVQKMHIATSDKPVALYSLDVILAVGYRANSGRAIEFRQWATKILRQHITQGYTLNRSVIKKNYDAFMKSVADIQALLPQHTIIDPTYALDLIKEFALTWMSLDAYDKETLPTKGATKKSVHFTAAQFLDEILRLKEKLVARGEATDIFATERSQGNIEGIIGNVMQSFGGTPVYPSIEEKAAHLLYFTIKNHPFVDGNKRVGAFAFVWFLQKAGLLRRSQITPPALTALTLFIAESDPKHKDRMVRVILQLLKK